MKIYKIIDKNYKNIKKINKFQKSVDKEKEHIYNDKCVRKTVKNLTGCGSAWLERLVWDQEVAGSNPVTPTETA